MTAFTDLTANQQAQLSALVPLVRSSLIPMQKAINQVSAVLAMWDAGLGAMNDGLSSGTVVPDTAGLAGAVPLTKDDMDNYITTARSLIAAFNTATNKTLILNAIGPANAASV